MARGIFHGVIVKLLVCIVGCGDRECAWSSGLQPNLPRSRRRPRCHHARRWEPGLPQVKCVPRSYSHIMDSGDMFSVPRSDIGIRRIIHRYILLMKVCFNRLYSLIGSQILPASLSLNHQKAEIVKDQGSISPSIEKYSRISEIEQSSLQSVCFRKFSCQDTEYAAGILVCEFHPAPFRLPCLSRASGSSQISKTRQADNLLLIGIRRITPVSYSLTSKCFSCFLSRDFSRNLCGTAFGGRDLVIIWRICFYLIPVSPDWNLGWHISAPAPAIGTVFAYCGHYTTSCLLQSSELEI